MAEIHYSVPVDGTRQEASYTTDEVSDPRAAWDEDVALAYARFHAGETFGRDINRVDFGDVEVERMGKPPAAYDETGSTGGGL